MPVWCCTVVCGRETNPSLQVFLVFPVLIIVFMPSEQHGKNICGRLAVHILHFFPEKVICGRRVRCDNQSLQKEARDRLYLKRAQPAPGKPVQPFAYSYILWCS